MNFQNKIKPIWESVQSAHFDGFLHNHDMFVFAFCKALPEKISTTYDGRQIHNTTHRPNFFIWSEGETPVITLVAKLRFGPSSSAEIEQDLAELRNYIKRPEINVLTNGEKQSETRMKMSSEIEFGYFILTDQSRHSVEKKIHHSLTDDERSRFHFAYGPSGEDDEQPQNFQYIPPQLRTE